MRAKYGNKKCEFDGYKFDSIKEMNRYKELVLLEAGKAIENLELQPKLEVQINGYKVCIYKPDFSYTEKGKRIFEDVKSYATRKLPVYRLKKKLVFAALGITILET